MEAVALHDFVNDSNGDELPFKKGSILKVKKDSIFLSSSSR